MNIFEIQDELRQIFDEIEELGGEVTEEIAEKLAITEEAFKTKVESYVNYIKELDGTMKCIKEEMARLKTLYERKEKLHDKLESLVIQAINTFGDTKKNGVKCYDYGTGSISVRKTQAIQTNDDIIDYIGDKFSRVMGYERAINTLDRWDNVDLSSVIDYIAEDKDVMLTPEELEKVDINLTVKIPFKDLATAEGYTPLKEVVRYSNSYKLTTSMSKTNLKPILKENGAATPNLAKLVINESLQIK